MTRYGFYLDTGQCTGCKACQIACKDKNDLPVGVLWRKVVEVQGGGWWLNGQVWVQDIFTYFVSTACNHCEAPICVEVCPTQAMHQREDGIVLVDTDRCMGCRYCEMACPYKAPQFDPARGVVAKCNLCVDLLEAGGPPVCVSACQMRVLHYGDLEELRNKYGRVDEVYPLPDSRLTRPALVLSPHPESEPAESPQAQIGNREEL
jgi:anaerobic dimethyl sulfoxide reductase subunit B (iron-sulfur subunit)